MSAGAVTGLAAEARIARRAGLDAVAGGGDADSTGAKIKTLLARGASGLVSFGICAGLDPALAPGDLLLPRLVWQLTPAVAETWHAKVAAALTAAGIQVIAQGAILGQSAMVQDRAEKAALFGAGGALALDMESHLVARAAGIAGLPFLVLRAVADSAGRNLPPAALVGLDREGRPQLQRVILSVLAHPRQLPALMAVARDTSRALAALRRAAPVLAAVPPE
ncbi:MAG TPA: hopanoid-associated phosphorylase [Stellaceae bacterium]|nr:hopanoid-associated phosphorylase [Stellaceae bacterium]